MSAGLAALSQLSQEGLYEQLYARVDQLLDGMQQLADEAGIPFTTNRAGSMFGFFFFTKEKQVTSYKQATECNMEHFKAFYHSMLKQGVYLAPSAFEGGFMSAAHPNKTLKTLWRLLRSRLANSQLNHQIDAQASFSLPLGRHNSYFQQAV